MRPRVVKSGRNDAKVKLFVLLFALLLTFVHALTADEYEDAARAFQRGDLTAAETAVRAVLSKQPDEAGALSLLGACSTRKPSTRKRRPRIDVHSGKLRILL